MVKTLTPVFFFRKRGLSIQTAVAGIAVLIHHAGFVMYD